MKTAEEILNSFTPEFIGCKPLITWEQAIKAMEEYATQFKQAGIYSNIVRPVSDVGGGELLQGEAREKGVREECNCHLPNKYCDCGKWSIYKKGDELFGG